MTRLTQARLLRRLVAIVGAALALIALHGTACAAQLRPQPTEASLAQVKLVSQSGDEARFQLIFEPRANTFTPVGEDPYHPSVGFALTSRRNSAVVPAGLKGLVRDISFEQAESILILHFGTASPATVAALPTGGRTVEVVVKSTNSGSSDDGLSDVAAPPGPAAGPTAYGDSYEMVLLKYADVSEIVGLLSQGASVKSNDLFIPREPQFGSNSLTGNQYNPGPTSQAPGSDDQPLGQSVDATMAIDRRLNAIWLRGSPDQIARLKAQIALIDQPLDSVVLETEFLELTESGAKALGIDFTNANGQIVAATFQSGQFVPFGVPPQGSVDNPSQHLTSIGVQAAIYAEIKKGNGRIVSKPRISAQSGSTAKIITGDALPILTSITLSGVNGVSQQVQYVNVGVTLQIAPRVSQDGFVSSHVFAVVSSVTGISQGYPTISQRQAETSATVRDGDSFVIGGLTQEDTITNKSKVPLLGDIPLIGQAFRTDRNTRAKTELYIIVTPHIVRRVLSRESTTSPVALTPGTGISAPPLPPPPGGIVPQSTPNR